jgi:peptidoglycan/LPS O-acetylase OafA/YrhL
VASTGGIGVGYPVAGLLTHLAGVRAAYALGLLVTLVVAALVLPPGPARQATRVDVRGAALLTAGLLGLLFTVSQTDLWRARPAACAAILVPAVLLLALLFPDPDGYTAAGWAGVLVTGLTVLAVLALRRRPADFPGR